MKKQIKVYHLKNNKWPNSLFLQEIGYMVKTEYTCSELVIRSIRKEIILYIPFTIDNIPVRIC